MKIFKYFLFLILIIFIGGSIFFATKNGTFDVAETKIIEAPVSVIYNNVQDFKNWQEWGPWMKIDSNIVINYDEKTEGEGASYSWRSDHNDVGSGSIHTLKVIPNKELDQKIAFNTPFGDIENDVYWLFEETEIQGQTKVTWGMKGEQSFMEKVFMAFQEEDMESGISEMFQSGLSNLNTIIKEEINSYIIQVDGITQYGGGYYLYNTTSSKQIEIGDKMASMLGLVMTFMEQNNLNMSGMPFTVYNEIDDLNKTVIFSTGIPVRERIITPQGSPIQCGYMKPMTVLKTTLTGKYDFLPKAYDKAKEYIAEKRLGIDQSANMFEVYSTDPGEFPNPADWKTEIYIPIVNPTSK